MPITKTDAETLPRNSIVWDTGRGSVSGFGVRRQQKHAVFILKYSVAGQQRWHSIGRFGVVTVDEARVKAKVLLGQVAAGDPPDRRARHSETPLTMADLCDRYMVAAQAGAVLTRFNRPKKASTLSIDMGRIARHIKPLVGSVLVADMDARKVKALIQDITVGKTAANIKTKSRGLARVLDEKRLQEMEKDDDQVAMQQIVRFLFDETARQAGLQIILIEHAYIEEDPEYVAAVEGRWTKASGIKLIPSDWPLRA